MNLHDNKELFRQAIAATAQHMQLRDIYIEKDYWVTFALHTIFNSEIGKETVFKGGTALSKCYKLIERFSEDIDLVVLRTPEESNNQLSNKIKKISKVVANVMPEVKVEGITQKMGMNRKTGHSYEKVFKGDYGQIRDVIIVEATWLGYFEPNCTKNISSYIYEMMLATGQQKIAEEYQLLPFEVQVLDSRRTICEKIMSLVRFSYEENPIADLKKKVRHTYDLHQLLKDEDLLVFFKSDNFIDMLLKVAQDDVASYRNKNQWLLHHPLESLMFNDLENTWSQLKETYTNNFKFLVFGSLPDEALVLDTLKLIKERLKQVTWNINVDNNEVTPQVRLVDELVEGLVESQKKIVKLIAQNPNISKKEMSEQVGISTAAIDKNIATLKNKHLIKRVSSDRGGSWQIIQPEK